jgi:hypothetical protein
METRLVIIPRNSMRHDRGLEYRRLVISYQWFIVWEEMISDLRV